MTEKDLRKLGRKELIEVIYDMKKRELDLQNRLQHAEAQLADKTAVTDNAGSIAEAALALSGVFGSAQEAADIYIENIRKNYADSEAMKKKTYLHCKQMINNAKAEAAKIIENAKRSGNGF